MPKPVFTDDDFVNSDAPEGERILKPDHWEVRDLSYEVNRMRQHLDLMKESVMMRAMDPCEACPRPGDVPEDAIPGPSLELFVKERPRGPGYVADFLYHSRDLAASIHPPTATLTSCGESLRPVRRGDRRRPDQQE